MNIEDAARALLGVPDADLSTDVQLWFGENLMIDLAAQTFEDFASDAADKPTGDALALVRHVLKLGREAAEEWLFEHVKEVMPAEPGNVSTDETTPQPQEATAGAAKWLPPDLQIERCLLGMLLVHPELAHACGEDVSDADFGSLSHAELFHVICACANDEAPVTAMRVVGALGVAASDEIVKDWTVGEYIAHLMASAPDKPDDAERATLARDHAKAIRRRADQERGVTPETDDPEQWEPKFGLMTWGQRHEPGREYEYLVEDLIPEQEISLFYGETGSGKSFAVTDLALCGAQGRSFFGRRILKPFGVIYCAYESEDGFPDRLRAYEVARDIRREDLPFALWRFPAPIWDKDGANIDLIIKEAQRIQRWVFGTVALGAIVIDTHNSATPGASEIDSEIVSKLKARYHRIRQELHCALWVVGHTNQLGRHRGNEQFYNNIETALRITKKTEGFGRAVKPVRDTANRIVRSFEIAKQRQGDEGEGFEFVLEKVEVGRINKFGKPRTSCVLGLPDGAEPIARDERKRDGAVRLNDRDVIYFRCLIEAIAAAGVPPPAGTQLPARIARVCSTTDVGAEYRKVNPREAGESDADYTARVLKGARETQRKLHASGVIAIMEDKGAGRWLVWPTGRPVWHRNYRWPSERPVVVQSEPRGDPDNVVELDLPRRS